mmetsp:Transcript_26824/g.73790  ORF Transcript_26824/g.73790 Transcript_26824/m.73790 type:complete len:89 (+) Transcript_26824:310-576(+)
MNARRLASIFGPRYHSNINFAQHSVIFLLTFCIDKKQKMHLVYFCDIIHFTFFHGIGFSTSSQTELKIIDLPIVAASMDYQMVAQKNP